MSISLFSLSSNHCRQLIWSTLMDLFLNALKDYNRESVTRTSVRKTVQSTKHLTIVGQKLIGM